jgi:glutamate dehydrogenase (NAD(P)+)
MLKYIMACDHVLRF